MITGSGLQAPTRDPCFARLLQLYVQNMTGECDMQQSVSLTCQFYAASQQHLRGAVQQKRGTCLMISPSDSSVVTKDLESLLGQEHAFSELSTDDLDWLHGA